MTTTIGMVPRADDAPAISVFNPVRVHSYEIGSEIYVGFVDDAGAVLNMQLTPAILSGIVVDLCALVGDDE